MKINSVFPSNRKRKLVIRIDGGKSISDFKRLGFASSSITVWGGKPIDKCEPLAVNPAPATYYIERVIRKWEASRDFDLNEGLEHD